MKKTLLLLVLLVVLVGIGWFVYREYTVPTWPGSLVTYSPFETSEQTKEIEVFLPTLDTTTIGTKFVIYGKGRAFENTINYRISDVSGKQLFVGSFMTNAEAGVFGYFHQEVDLVKILKTIPPIIILDVLELSAKDGSDIHKTSFNLTVDQNSTTVLVYFSNNKLDPEITCEKVYAVARIVPKTTSVLKVAIEELLRGPAMIDTSADFKTSINSSVKLNYAKIENSVAYLDFDNRLQESIGGSCRVQAIRRQIEVTAKQFSTVKDVAISINGVTEPILQP